MNTAIAPFSTPADRDLDRVRHDLAARDRLGCAPAAQARPTGLRRLLRSWTGTHQVRLGH